jgi:calcyclin binding protein
MSAEELRLDLDELRRLEGLATRPRVLSLLANEIRTVDAKVASFSLSLSHPSPPALAADRFRSARRVDCGSCFRADVSPITDSWPLPLRPCRLRRPPVLV